MCRYHDDYFETIEKLPGLHLFLAFFGSIYEKNDDLANERRYYTCKKIC
jgi:hypothetical protein